MSVRRLFLWLLPAFAVGLLIADLFLENWFQRALNDSRSAWTTIDLPGTDWSIADLAIDAQHRIWVAGADKGVAVFDGKAWGTFDGLAALEGDDVGAIAFDDQGGWWVGTDRGLRIFNGTAWRTYTAENSGLAHDMVWAIQFDPQGRAWLGTDGGVSLFEGTTWTTYTPRNSGLPCPSVRSIAIDAAGRAWMGSEEGAFGHGCGLSIFDGTTWTTFTAANSGLASDDVRAIAFDRHGRAWIGTLKNNIMGWDGAGVSVYDGKTWTIFNVANSRLASNLIFDLAVDDQDRVWIANGALSTYDGRGWTNYFPSNSGLASPGAEAIAADSSGRVWTAGADLDGRAALSLLEPGRTGPVPAFATDVRAAIFAPDVRLFAPSLLMIVWLGVLLHWPLVLTALALAPGLLSLAGGEPLMCICPPVKTISAGIAVTYGASAGALVGSLIERARGMTPTARASGLIIILAIVGALVAFIAVFIQALGCVFEFFKICS